MLSKNSSAQASTVIRHVHECLKEKLTTMLVDTTRLVSYQNRPRVDGLVPKSDIHQGSAEFHIGIR